MRLVPHSEVMAKMAALRSADALGRQMAQDRAVEELAKLAGALLVQGPELEKVAEVEQIAREMVKTGKISEEQFQFLKEAGLFSRMGKWIAGGGVKRGIRSMRSTMAGGLRRMGATGMAQRVAPAKISGRAAAEARRAKPAGFFERRRARKAMEQQVAAGPQVAKDQPIQIGKTKAQPQTSTPTGSQPPAKSQTTPPAQTQTQPTGGGGGESAPSKGFGLGRLALYGGLGLGAYGLYKGVGWGARQLEQSSATPMAYGAGWSPVPYGYGSTPYGPGMPTMGYGA